MAVQILLPQWGMEMQEATVVKWLKKEGDSVEEGEPLLEVETAKMETEIESIASGVVAHIMVPEGTTVEIRTLLAIIAAPGEDVPRPATSATMGSAPAPAARQGVAPSARAEGRTNRQIVPAARRLAQQHGVDLDRVEGSGPRGRVLIADVEVAIQSRAGDQGAVVPITGMRKTIATRMLQSSLSSAQVTLTTEADLTDAMALRDRVAPAMDDGSLSPLHLVIKATARALGEHPRMNAIQRENEVVLSEDVNVGIAVSLAEGLLVPTIRNADTRSLSELAGEARRLAKKTREGKATPDEVTGGTFTVTNLGAYDIDAFTPIINPPQVGILGVGRVVEKPAVHEGEITARSMMYLSLTFDHRVIDGAPAAEFLRDVKRHLEDPAWMAG